MSSPGSERMYGKYRATVTSNEDPLKLGRVQVSVAQFPGIQQSWALPSAPYGGKGVGFYAIPPVGANVWVEFEGGNLDTPIWSGCFWNEGELPSASPTPTVKVFKTDAITMTLDDSPENKGSFSLVVDAPAVSTKLTMTFNDSGITIDCPTSKITMTTEQIKLENPQASITLKADSIQITVPPAELSMSSSAVTTKVPPAEHSVTSSSIKSATPPSSCTVAPASVDLACGVAKATVSAAQVGLSNGAGSVSVSPASVTVNNGALVVI